MPVAEQLITDHLDIWSTTVKPKSSAGRGNSNGKQELYGIKKLRELILELAVRGLLVPKTHSWERNQFGKIFDIQGGTQPPKSQFIFEPQPGYVRLLQIRDLGDKPVPTYIPEDSARRFCNSNDILIGRYGASVGKVFKGQEGAYNVALAKLVWCSEVFSQDFLITWLKSSQFQKHLEGASRSAQAGFNKGDLAKIEIMIPPLAEQHRIVAKVDELMALCDQLEGQQANHIEAHQTLVQTLLSTLTQSSDATQFATAWTRIQANFDTLFTTESSIDQLKQTILQLAVMGKLVPQDPNDEPASELLAPFQKQQATIWPRKYSHPTEANQTELPSIPKGWHWYRAEQICGYITKGTTPSKHDMFETEGEVPFLKVYNLTFSGRLDFTIKPTYINRNTHDNTLDRSRVFPGDVLMNIVGPPLGKVSVIPSDFGECNVNQAIAIFPPLEGVSGDYLSICLLQIHRFAALAGAETRGSAGQDNISLGQSRDLPVPLPPLSEQHRIVAKVDELMSLCDALKAKLQATQTTQVQLTDTLVNSAIGDSNSSAN